DAIGDLKYGIKSFDGLRPLQLGNERDLRAAHAAGGWTGSGSGRSGMELGEAGHWRRGRPSNRPSCGLGDKLLGLKYIFGAAHKAQGYIVHMLEHTKHQIYAIFGRQGVAADGDAR